MQMITKNKKKIICVIIVIAILVLILLNVNFNKTKELNSNDFNLYGTDYPIYEETEYSNYIEYQKASGHKCAPWYGSVKEDEKIKTERGIRIGSTKKEVIKAYGDGIKDKPTTKESDTSKHKATSCIRYQYSEIKNYLISFTFDQNDEVMIITYE